MFKLDQAVFKMVYDYCETIGNGFGFGVLEGFFINGMLIAGTVLIAINKAGRKAK